MNIWKLIRGFCKVTATPYRAMKRDYARMKPEAKRGAKVNLQKFWDQNEKQNLLNHKKYYDLKKPLVKTLQETMSSEKEVASI